MGWKNVIVTKHSKVSYSEGRIIIQTNQEIYEVAIKDMDLLILDTPQVVITGRAVSEMAKQNIVIIFTSDTGHPICETANYYANNRTSHTLKHQFNWRQMKKEQLWTQIIISKIKHQIEVVDKLGEASESLNFELKHLEIGDATNREAVVARKYFPILYGQNFKRREFNEINASLNYGYNILLTFINKLIIENGYLTQLGIHHDNNENEFNFSCDLLEPFRPIIELWVAKEKIKKFNIGIKAQLVDLLNLEIKYNQKRTILRNALKTYVADCIDYLNGDIDNLKLEMEFSNEVSNNAINGNV